MKKVFSVVLALLMVLSVCSFASAEGKDYSGYTIRIYSNSNSTERATWLENAALFAPGDAVTGIVRSVQEYGVFIELTPNLSGLADWRRELMPGDMVSVYIKSIRPENRKIKLQVIRRLGRAQKPSPFRYFMTDGTTENWTY